MNFRFVVPQLVIVLCVTGCVKEAELQALRDEVKQLALEADQLKNDRSALEEDFRVKNGLATQFQRLQEREAKMRLELEQIHRYVDQLKVAQEYVDARLPQWREATRRSLKGLRLGNVDLINGTSLVDAEVVEVADASVKIKHARGESDYPIDELPEAARVLLVHEPTVLAQAKLGKVGN